MAITLLVSSLGSAVAVAIGAPLPFLLGALVAAAAFSLTFTDKIDLPLMVPMKLREVFIVVIGVMIGSAFSPDLFGEMGVLVPGSIAVVVFVVGAQGMNYLIFRHGGGYGRMTAITAGMPGGLIDSIAIAEEKGGDTGIVTAQQFLRIALIVTTLPIAFSIWQGEAVGSAAGMQFATKTGGPADWALLAAAGITGYFVGKALNFPAHVIVGPMAVSGFIHGIGWTDAAIPPWLFAVAQLIVGAGLGTRFTNLKGRDVRRIVTLGLLSAAAMVALGIAISIVLSKVTGTPIPVLILSFAPGGLIEMGLIALSLEASPVIVTLYHIIRILVTVVLASLILRRMEPDIRR